MTPPVPRPVGVVAVQGKRLTCQQAEPDKRDKRVGMADWTIVRFPAGDWSGGGSRNSPDYAECEVYVIGAESFDKAKKKAQSVRSGLVKKGAALPTQAAPYISK